MAGRGTDIKLDKALDLGQPEAGLQIIGTERHESRRIDRQLRGRSGRQGDPGQSIFFLSLEDDLMRLFGSDRIARWMDKSGAEEGEVITGGLVTRAIEQAQKRVELQNFQSRKRLLEYDDVMNQQREVIYSLRLFALERGEELKAEARRMIEAALERAVTQFMATAEQPEEWDRGGLREALTLQYLVTVDALTDADATPSIDRMVELAKAEGEESFRRKIEYLSDFGRTIGIPDVDSQVLSQVMLTVLDGAGRITCTISTSSGTRSSTGPGGRRIRWSSTSARPSRCSRTSCTTSSPRSPSGSSRSRSAPSARNRRGRRRRLRRRRSISPRRPAALTNCSWVRRPGFLLPRPPRPRVRRPRRSTARSDRWAAPPPPYRKSGATIPARAAPARSTRSVTGWGGSGGNQRAGLPMRTTLCLAQRVVLRMGFRRGTYLQGPVPLGTAAMLPAARTLAHTGRLPPSRASITLTTAEPSLPCQVATIRVWPTCCPRTMPVEVILAMLSFALRHASSDCSVLAPDSTGCDANTLTELPMLTVTKLGCIASGGGGAWTSVVSEPHPRTAANVPATSVYHCSLRISTSGVVREAGGGPLCPPRRLPRSNSAAYTKGQASSPPHTRFIRGSCFGSRRWAG